MRFESELATAFKSCNTFHTFEKYAELLSPELIQQGFKQAEVATIRKRRLPLKRCFGQSLEWLSIDKSQSGI